MTQEELKQRFMELLRTHPIDTEVQQLYYKAVHSGALNIADEPASDYRLPKIILYAVLSAMAETWQPTLDYNRQEAENLKLFI
ncbi:hypothetical protein [Pedobacter panaciterrae]